MKHKNLFVLLLYIAFPLVACSNGSIPKVKGIEIEKTDQAQLIKIFVNPEDKNGPTVIFPIMPGWGVNERIDTDSEVILTFFNNKKYTKATTPDLVVFHIYKTAYANDLQSLMNTASGIVEHNDKKHKLLYFSGYTKTKFNSKPSLEYTFITPTMFENTSKTLSFNKIFALSEKPSKKFGPVIASYAVVAIKDDEALKQITESNIPLFKDLFNAIEFKNFEE